MKALFITGIGFTLIALGGCASTANWQHPARVGDGYDGATMALAECQAYASGLGPAPAPTARMDAPAPTSYTTTGSYTQNGSYGTFRGTTTANRSFSSDFAAGYNSGAALGDAVAAIKHQSQVKEVTAACMRTQGWIDTSLPEGKAKFVKLFEAKANPAPPLDEQKVAKEEWSAVIRAFMQIEASRRGGIDYRNDPKRLQALDKYVKQLGNDPKNNQQNMAWFLVEAHKLVLADDQAGVSLDGKPAQQ